MKKYKNYQLPCENIINVCKKKFNRRELLINFKGVVKKLKTYLKSPKKT